MRSTIYIEETLHVGTETFVDSVSPQGQYAVSLKMTAKQAIML